jgi:dTDP-4-amino-4,6-dideoxygalactose transaminase
MRIVCERGNDAFPMSQLQAAVLLPQLAQLDRDHAVRRANVTRLCDRLSSQGGWSFPIRQQSADVFYKVPIVLEGGLAPRTHFLAHLESQGVEIGEGFRGFALRSSRRCRKPGPLINSIAQAERTCLLHHPVFLADDRRIDELAQRLEEALNRSRNGE